MIEPIRISEEGPKTLAGFEGYFKFNETDQISGLWQRFGPQIGSVPGQVGDLSYGLSHGMDGSGFKYLASVEVSNAEGLPDEYTVVEMPANRWAVFAHNGHVSQLKETGGQIWQKWFPQSGESPAQPTFMLERYDERFDPKTASGYIEIWISIK